MTKYFAMPLIFLPLAMGAWTAVNLDAELRQVQNGDASYVYISRVLGYSGQLRYDRVVVVDRIDSSSAYSSVAKSGVDIFRST